jgi:WD40 repeat protein
MKKTLPFALFLLALGALPASAAPIPVAEVKHDGNVDFEKEILPILRKKCLACHNTTEKESDLILETPQTILKGGSEGPAVKPGDAATSLLMIVGSHAKEPIMPPKGNDVGAKPLTSEELGLIKLWITQGAKGEVLGNNAPIVWQPLPAGVNPIYAVAVSQTGEYAAAGRANQVFLYHLPSKRELGRLTDPKLLESGVYKNPGVADLDLIQALAFSPDGSVLATGGYRTLKLWRRPVNLHKYDLPALANPARTSATSADGKWIAIGEETGAIQLYDATNGQPGKKLEGHTGAVTSLAFAADNATLYSGSMDKTVRAWSLAEAKETKKIDCPAEVKAMALVGKGDKIAVSGPENAVLLYSTTEAGEPKKLAGHANLVIAIAPMSETQFASATAEGAVKVWNIEAGNSAKDLNHGGPITGLVARSDGKRIITAGANNISKLHNLENNQVVELRGDLNVKYKADELTRSLALAKRHVDLAKKDLDDATKRKTAEEENAKKAAEAVKKAEEEAKAKTEAAKKPTEDKEAADKALADATTAKTAAEEGKKKADEAQKVAADAFTKATQERDAAVKAATEAETAFNAAKKKLEDAKKAATADAANAGLADAAKAAEKEQADAEAKNKAAAEAKIAKEKVFTDSDAAKKAADTAKQGADKAAQDATNAFNQAMQKVQQLMQPYQKAVDEKNAAVRNHEAAVRSVERSMTAVKAATDAIPTFDAALKANEEKAKAAEAASTAGNMAVAASEKPYKAIAISQDGKTVAIAGDAMIVYTFDTENGAALGSFTGHAAAINSLAFTADGNILSTADKAAIVWNAAAEWKLERTIGTPDASSPIADRVTAIDFSPDGTLVATGSGEPSRSGQLKIWKVADGSLAQEIKDPHSDTIYDVEFSPSGQHIATCGADRFMKVWDLTSGKLHRSYEGHTHHVLGVTWRSDGRLLASSGADNVVKVWNFQTGDQLRTMQGFGKEVTAITFAGDGDAVVASSGDKSVKMKNAENGGDMRSFAGATDFLYAVASSGDGKTIVAGGADGVVLVWNDQGQAVATFAAPKPQ